VFAHASKMGLYRSGRSPDWLRSKNPAAPAVKREAEKDWGKDRWRRNLVPALGRVRGD
jgi:hypothetical protein